MWRLDDLRGANNYLDTNVLIYAFEGDEADNRRHQLGALFRDLAEGRAQASASVIARTEALARPLREGDLPLVNWYRELLSGRGLVEVLAVNQVIADLAAELRAEQRSLRVPDALHLATAIHIGCASFVTADEKLAIAAHRIRVLLLGELEKRLDMPRPSIPAYDLTDAEHRDLIEREIPNEADEYVCRPHQRLAGAIPLHQLAAGGPRRQNWVPALIPGSVKK